MASEATGAAAALPSTRRAIALSPRADDALAPARITFRSSARRADLMLALALAVLSVAQVLCGRSRSRPLGVAIALVSTLPIAWRRDPPGGGRGRRDAAVVHPHRRLRRRRLHRRVRALLLARRVRRATCGAWSRSRRTRSALSVLGSWLNHEVAGRVHGRGDRGRAAGAGRARRAPPAQQTSSSTADRRARARARADRAARVAEERARIARELHDVVAHGLSVIAIQADGAEAALDRDPELARRPLARDPAVGRGVAGRDAAAARRAARGRGGRRPGAAARARRSCRRWSSGPAPPGCR